MLQGSCHFDLNDDISQNLIQLLWTENILENIGNFLSLIHPTEQFLRISFVTESYYIVHPRLALNSVPFHLSIPSIVVKGSLPRLSLKLTDQFVSLQFARLRKQKQGGYHRHTTQVPLPYIRKQCDANQAINKAHQNAWGQLGKKKEHFGSQV